MRISDWSSDVCSSDLTADYDRAIRRWTREMRWRSAMIEALAPRAGEMIVDVGCGTGRFAVMLKRAAPGVNLIGVDPDVEALAREEAGRVGNAGVRACVSRGARET